MKPLRSAAALLLAAIAAATAQAQSSRTRADVLRELAEARRMGDIPIAGCGGGTLRENFPQRYPPTLRAASDRGDPGEPRRDDIAARDTREARPDPQR